MTAYQLAVTLQGNGNLAPTLEQAATAARTLDRDLAAVHRALGQLSSSGGRLRGLAGGLSGAAAPLRSLRTDASGAGTALRRLGSDAERAARAQRTSGTSARTAANDLQAMSRQARAAASDLGRLNRAAGDASGRLVTVGGHGERSMGRIEGAARRAGAQIGSMAGLLAGGGLLMGLHDLVETGNEYQKEMNQFGAVTGANSLQMQHAGAVAHQLGNDLSLPASTAADAAEAMVDLAKAGFRADQAIVASRAALQLATGMHVKAADAAMYLGDAMDQFGLGADQASRAADTLAATATGASGGIRDIWYAMKYAGPVANALGVSMQDTAAAIVGLGKAGIIGQTAGTTLRGALSNMAAPTDQMKEGLRDLGIEAFDSAGKFKGLAVVIEGLNKAQHSMSQQSYTEAVKKAFGKPAMSGMIALGHQGIEAFRAGQATVSQYGKAAEIAAAQSKGLTGAMTQLKTQSKTTGLAIYQGMSPGLEYITRGLTRGMSAATPKIDAFFKYLNDAATLFGPDVAAAARRTFGDIGNAAGRMLAPLKDTGENALASFLHMLLTTGQAGARVLKNLASGAEPIVKALADVASGSSGASTALDILVLVIDAAARGIGTLSGVLGPIGHVVAGIVSAFGALPAPIQTALFAMLLFRRAQPVLAGLAGTVRGQLTGAYQSLNQQMAVQRTLAAASGESLTRYGAAMAVLETRVPTIGAMANSFRSATAAGTGFTATLRGVAAAAGTGLRGAFSGLVGAMGGPWGVALAGLTVGLGLLASAQARASQEAAQHKANIDGLTSAMRQSNGATTEAVRQQAAQAIQSQKLSGIVKGSLMDAMHSAGYSVKDVTDAYLGQGRSLDELAAKMKELAKQEKDAFNKSSRGDKNRDEIARRAMGYEEAAKALQGMAGDADKARRSAKELNEAANNNNGTTAYGKLKDAVGALADKTADADSRTRALRASLDLLSGGSISLQAAQARVNEAITNANEAMKTGIDRSAGWGKQLINSTSGALDTTTKNGQALFTTLNNIADSSGQAAIAAWDFAQQQNKSVPESLKAARAEMEKARAAAIELGTGYGLSKKEAEGVADAMGLIPGRVSILLQTKGMDTALAELLAVQAEFERFPDQKVIKVDALGEGAQKELKQLGYQIELIPGTRQYKITAPTLEARKQLDALINKMSAVPDKKVNVSASTAQAVGQLQTLQQKINEAHGGTVTMTALTGEARQRLEELGFKVRSMPNGQAEITIPAGTPLAAIQSIQGAINGVYGKDVTISATTIQAVEQLQGLQAKVNDAHGGTVTMTALTDEARKQLEDLGFKVQNMPNGQAEVTIPTGGPLAAISSIQGAINSLYGKDINIGVHYNSDGSPPSGVDHRATGGVIDYYANGGIRHYADGSRREDHVAQIAPAGAWRVWAEPETGGEAYIPLNPAKRSRSRRIADETVRRLGGGPVEWYAEGGLSNFSYTPASMTTISSLVSDSQDDSGNFSLSKFTRRLRDSIGTANRWRRDLATVADRAGTDVAKALEEMGKDGVELTRKMATGSSKYVRDMAQDLRDLAKASKASLGDYTGQLQSAVKDQNVFQSNLAKLAAAGYGDLAARLAAQGDQAAADLADQAVRDSRTAREANNASKDASGTLSGDQLSALVQIIGAVKDKNTGLHAVADTTGLDEELIITVANKARGQIEQALGSRSTRLLNDLLRANRGLSYADGGIRAGMYATSGGIVRFAEPETGGEAYLPLGLSKRRQATAVLDDVAGRFGYALTGLQDASAGRVQVVVVQQAAPLIGTQTIQVDRPGATEQEIADAIGYQLRRAQRGGARR
ncbi:phage tail tape measure protein [Streptomyces sp. NPDC001404]|uniref:phage tail tape measure protein n=1 Tax=Streptomyces sp. NPDC001404 TaxID=3364571 RepID=UPI00369B56A5